MIDAVDTNSQAEGLRRQISGPRVKAMRKRRGLSQRALAALAGSSASQISTVEHDESQTSLRATIALADALGTSVDFLVNRVDDSRPVQTIATELKTKAARVRDLEAGHIDRVDPQSADYVGIAEIDATVGAGSTTADGPVRRRHKFLHAWVREHELKADLCRIVRVAGEAMEPTVSDGALILIDTASTEHRDSKIYVLRIKDEVIVRRLIHDHAAGWLLHCDNPDKTAWPTQPWPENGITVGEVRGAARTFI